MRNAGLRMGMFLRSEFDGSLVLSMDVVSWVG